ncbi:LytTR family DNA-binding domain-containing protein [Rhabdobacter roseus]|uniref:DNA-binding LytR/AlgR family response regulator n=1 Tax=Rhabdobacter roseus TaxID=1655419 RepID=A0A840U6K4_9BACT|nr:LytTR family DNA-binding domain-containing protein [Rhabdobacter roseus]MBB5287449.1 DNA-binding LytR/AlgR family response regulator [Rhabdobacter roseus]
MLRCVVIDDEPLAREVLQNYLQRLDCVRSVRLFGHAQDALEYLRHHEADVLFLDIEMPELNGLDFLRALPQPPLTVFTTAYRHYAYEGFELGVIDFLLKPIAYARFRQAIEKIREFLALKEQNTQLETGASLGTVFVKSGTQRIKLNLADVTYLQGLKDYAIIYTDAGQIVLKGTLKAMHAIFPPSQFVRVHKSFIVAVSRITRLERNRLIINGNPVPIGRNYKEEIEALVGRG